MWKRTRQGLRAAIVTVVAGLLMPAAARAQTPNPIEAPQPSTTAKVLDALILRPLGFLVLPVGVAAFIPCALLAAPSGMENVRAALELFVTSPASYVFTRPLGDV